MAAFSGTQAAAVLDKLEARQEARKAEREQRQQELEKVADPREDIQRFLEAFSKDHCDLQQRCSDLEQRAAASGQDDSEKQAILQQLEDIAGHTSVLEQKISDAAYFLPPYDLRSCNGHLQQLRSQLAAIKQQLQPKRKFAFSKAVKKTHVAAPAVAAQQPADTAPVDQSTAADAAPAGPTSHDLQLISAGYGFMGLRNQSIIQTAEHLAGQAFVLHDLAECTVYLLGHMSALRLQKLQNCRVYTGPVSGATFVSGASGCTLMIASHQVGAGTVPVTADVACIGFNTNISSLQSTVLLLLCISIRSISPVSRAAMYRILCLHRSSPFAQ